MNLFGIPLRRPTFNEATSATVLGVGLWILLLGVLRRLGVETSTADAVASLIAVVWSCVAVQLGIHVGRGARHVAANLSVGGVLLLAWHVAAQAFGG